MGQPAGGFSVPSYQSAFVGEVEWVRLGGGGDGDCGWGKVR